MLTATLERLIEHTPRPVLGDNLRSYLGSLDLLGHGFDYTELVEGTRKKGMPPLTYWPDLARTLALCNVFRERARDAGGCAGCDVVAVYRPSGGEDLSAHKRARAIDLDAIKPRQTKIYFEVAVRLWCEYGQRLSVGLGLYTWSRWNKSGIRVHLDTGYHCRSWQGVSLGPKFQRPYKILCRDGRTRSLGLPVYLATQMGLDVPSLDYL